MKHIKYQVIVPDPNEIYSYPGEACGFDPPPGWVRSSPVKPFNAQLTKRPGDALSERPSRFDRVFRLTHPNKEQRSELVKQISRKVPISEDVKEYMVSRTEGFTPAQIKEILHSMVISHIDTEEETVQFDQSDVDSAIGWTNTKKNGTIGFNGMSISHTTINTVQHRPRETTSYILD